MNGAGIVSDTIGGSPGPDTLTASYYGSTLTGGGGDDRLVGGSYDDLLDGGDGADTLVSGGGRDTILGGAGADVVDIADSHRDTRITLGAGADLVRVNLFQQLEEQIPGITDFTGNEDGIRFAYVVSGNYGEGTAATFAAAQTLSKQMAANGFRVVSIQVGADVFVFGHWNQVKFDSCVRLINRTLDDIAGANVGIFTNTTVNDTSTMPAAPNRITAGTVAIAGNMDAVDVGVLQAKNLGEVTASRIVLDGPGLDIILTGANFSTDATRTQLFGQVTGFALGSGGVEINVTNMAGKELGGIIDAIDAKNAAGMLNFVMSGSDLVSGSAGGDLIRAGFGDDVIRGMGGADTIYAGGGNDVIYATAQGLGGASQTYLRGDDGSDWILGSDGFDDINGNAGSDTASGGLGDDWVVGGKDGDRLFGDAGNDLVYGNIGSDVCYGGEGNDTVRGGQDNDQVFGGAGADFLSGDKGNDTMVGGAGADIFSSFVGTDLDRIEDFNYGEGDRLMLPTGTQYTTEQVGPDLILSLVGGGRVLMANMTMTNLPNGWIIFGG